MLIVETIAKIRREHREGKPIKEIARDLRLSRNIRVLASVPEDGLEAVEAAVREAMMAGTANDEVILNILSRRREPQPAQAISVLVDLKLKHPPIADCARYDMVRGLDAAA